MCWRKIYDRNPLFPTVTDKYAVRQYVVETLGERRAGEVLIPLLFHTREPSTIPFHDLPVEYVVKANHGCAMNMILREGHSFTHQDIVDRCEKWLQTVYGRMSHQWAYGQVEPRILIEELISGPDRSPPLEFKLHMFDGRCALIQQHRSPAWYDGSTADTDPARLPRINFYTPDWAAIQLAGEFPAGPAEPKPVELPEILGLAEELSRSFDYIRVDVYSTPDGIRVGELTVYPHEGRWKMVPRQFDYDLGARWRLPG